MSTNKLITHRVDGEEVVSTTNEHIDYYSDGISVVIDHENSIFINYNDLVSIEYTDTGECDIYENGELK